MLSAISQTNVWQTGYEGEIMPFYTWSRKVSKVSFLDSTIFEAVAYISPVRSRKCCEMRVSAQLVLGDYSPQVL